MFAFFVNILIIYKASNLAGNGRPTSYWLGENFYETKL